ncbi:MAG: methyl-accepting chemotaxis protein, partial [Nitrospirota bacterium]
DETTQQNAALVEEATSASQSMKEQAQGLMRQVASFKITGSGQKSPAPVGVVHAGHRTHASPVRQVRKPLLKKPGASHTTAQKPVGVAAGDGKDRGWKDEFEEF